ncbi:hypothetical protein L226DRAFT_563826 [Lentinus tigrinus ALCF2SS1-7]|uniref:uncharacterized protein n=1 Tax=Lentinus tigrinus ALCF2SS1-7 TaxID=1328758 RepID=UPI001165F308|nr:hypothetical protein L226DRAFT_563826 [Lentinus tigrinus ALCF2SS1-7]
MSSSSSTHTFAKRGMSLDPPLIAGIVVVVVAFNLIIAVSWCIVRDRRKLKKLHKRRISGPVDCEKYENSVAFAISTGAAAPLKAKAKEHDRRAETGKSYYELLQALQSRPDDAFSPVPTRWSRASSGSASSAESHGIAKFVLRPHDMKDLSGTPLYPKSKGASHTQVARDSVNLGVPERADLRRANSLTETASVYSSASAPLELHDQLLRTQPFVLPTSAPAWMGEMPKPPWPAILSRSDTSSIDVDVPCPSQSTSSASSVASTIVPRLPNPHLPIAVSPISVPSSSTPSPVPVRPRTYSNPTAPPQIHWITPPDNAASPVRTRRPNSISSLSTIFSVQEATRVPAVAPVTVTPLNVRTHGQRHDSRWGSVDLSRSPPLGSSSGQLGVPDIAFVPATPTTPALAQTSSGPAVPARSPRRPAPGSASVEHLPGGTA